MSVVDDLIAEIAARFPNGEPGSDEAFAEWRDTQPVWIRRVIDRELGARAVDGWRAHPSALMHYLTGNDWWLRPHIGYLSRKYVELVDGTNPRQIWNLPARMGKSQSHKAGAIWNLDRTEGRARSIFISYVKKLATTLSVEVRDAIAQYDEIDADPQRGRFRQDEWYTTAGGGILSAGVGSAIIGFGVNEEGVLTIDDPIENWQKAHNEPVRKLVQSEYQGTWRHRLDSEAAAILVVHHRMHRGDPSGWLTQAFEDGVGERFDTTVMPMIATDDDVLGRDPGEVLDREAFDLDDLATRHIGMGSWVVAAVEQQDPPEEQGNELLREWFRIEDQMPPAFDRAMICWDLKLKNKESGDFVAGQAWGKVGSTCYLVDGIRGQWDHATTMNAIALLAVRHPSIKSHVVEAAGAVDDIVPALRKGDPDYVLSDEMCGRLGIHESEREAVEQVRRQGLSGIVLHAPVSDKVVRARTWIAPLAEAGDVVLNERWTGLGPFLDEAAAFPDGEYDDQVDTSSMALQRLQVPPGTIRRPPSDRRVSPVRRPASGRVVRPSSPRR